MGSSLNTCRRGWTVDSYWRSCLETIDEAPRFVGTELEVPSVYQTWGRCSFTSAFDSATLFRGSSRFLSHHSRFTCGCNKEGDRPHEAPAPKAFAGERQKGPASEAGRCRPHMAQCRQSRPVSGHGFQMKGVRTFFCAVSDRSEVVRRSAWLVPTFPPPLRIHDCIYAHMSMDGYALTGLNV